MQESHLLSYDAARLSNDADFLRRPGGLRVHLEQVQGMGAAGGGRGGQPAKIPAADPLRLLAGIAAHVIGQFAKSTINEKRLLSCKKSTSEATEDFLIN